MVQIVIDQLIEQDNDLDIEREAQKLKWNRKFNLLTIFPLYHLPYLFILSIILELDFFVHSQNLTVGNVSCSFQEDPKRFQYIWSFISIRKYNVRQKIEMPILMDFGFVFTVWKSFST